MILHIGGGNVGNNMFDVDFSPHITPKLPIGSNFFITHVNKKWCFLDKKTML
jgi:hypothetical protein